MVLDVNGIALETATSVEVATGGCGYSSVMLSTQMMTERVAAVVVGFRYETVECKER